MTTTETHEQAISDESSVSASPEEAEAPGVASEDAVDAGENLAEGEGTASAEAGEPLDAAAERRRIEEQLDALRRRESELRRELAKADHPELAEVIRELEICVYQVNRADARLAEGLTKSEQRRRATLTKKLDGLVEKRDKLEAQIAELQAELVTVGEQRIQGYADERREAMERLVTHMGAHLAGLRAAGVEPAELIPEIGAWTDELRALAEELAAAKA